MKTILDNLARLAELLRLTKIDVQEGQNRLNEAELKVSETMALLQARRENLELGSGKAQRSDK